MSLFDCFCVVAMSGRLTRDPELRTLPNGTQLCEFSLAINKRIKRGDEWTDQVSYIDTTAFGKTAELMHRFGKKGGIVIVQGTLNQDRWKDKASGQNRTRLSVRADELTFINAETKEGGSSGRGRQDEYEQSSYDENAEAASEHFNHTH